MSQRIIPAASMSQGLGVLLQGCSQRRGAAAIGQERSWPWPGHKHQGLGSAELDLPQSGGEGNRGDNHSQAVLCAGASLSHKHPAPNVHWG